MVAVDDTLDQASKGILSVESLTEALAAGAPATAADEAGDTLLHKCARAGRVDLCEQLLDSGADIDAVDKRGQSALFSAVEFGRTAVMLMLLGRGADASLITVHTGWNILHMAAYNSHVETMKALLSKLPKEQMSLFVNMGDCERRTPLHTAAFRSQAEMVRLLMERDAKPTAADVRNNTPVELAHKVGKDETVALLEEAGTTPVAHAVANPARRKSSILKEQAAIGVANVASGLLCPA